MTDVEHNANDPEFQVLAGTQLTAAQLHELLRLRIDVFVVEQECPYPELDGRDLREDTTHLWRRGPDDEVPVEGYLRILTDPSAKRIGRVVTHPAARGRGLASQMMEAALRLTGSEPVVLDAQSHLTEFYATFAFVPDGPEYVEDGIPHVPMKRAGIPCVSPDDKLPGASS